ncbi:hypothetical protein HK102_012611 [Quaeritorhiza haematococci]|nr:hypothetical protein HK102_012611 [Quaeritorhiza haematococci]
MSMMSPVMPQALMAPASAAPQVPQMPPTETADDMASVTDLDAGAPAPGVSQYYPTCYWYYAGPAQYCYYDLWGPYYYCYISDVGCCCQPLYYY